MVVRGLFNHFWDGVTLNSQEMREVVGILPKAATGMQSGTLKSTNLGQRSLWSTEQPPQRTTLCLKYAYFFAPVYCQFPLK